MPYPEIPTVHLSSNTATSARGSVGDALNPYIVSYRQVTKRMGGYWTCNFTLKADKQRLLDWFYQLLGQQVRCHISDLTCWMGMVYDTTLYLGNMTRIRSFEDMVNAVKSTYIDDDGNVQNSSFSVNQSSIDEFGRKEEIITLDQFDQTAAEQRRDTYLKDYAFPYPIAIGSNFSPTPTLEVMACGYAWTANWKYVSTTTLTGASDDVDGFLNAIITNDVEFLTLGKIQTNTTPTKRAADIPIRAWDLITDLTSLGDSNYDPYKSYVDENKRFYYEELDFGARYSLRDQKVYGGVGSSIETNPWLIEPAVCRDLDYPVSRAEYNSPYSDARDFYIDEVEVRMGGEVTFKTIDFDEGEIITAQQEYARWMDEYEEKSSKVGSGASSVGQPERLNWKRKIGLEPGTPEWDKAMGATPAEKKKMIEEWKKKKKKKG